MTLVGWTLIIGFVTFMIGAAGWRIEYERPMEVSLPLMHADRRRLRWIHGWMLPAIFLTSAGLGGLARAIDEPAAAIAASAYVMGAVLWAAALLFRLSVGEWAAERTAVDGTVPELYRPLSAFAGYGHLAHMLAAYLTAIPLAWAAVRADLLPTWLGWAGAIWGLAMAIVAMVPRTRGIAAPPFWAHTFTFVLGLALVL